MVELDNRSAWTAGLYPGWSRKGERQMTLVFKAGFAFDAKGTLTPLATPAAIEETDRYFGEPGRSSLAAAGETVPFKQGSELLLCGTAHPPKADATVTEVAIGLRGANDRFWEKTLRVFGPRCWEKGLLGISFSKPAPLSPLPLRYEHAYGGCDPNHDDTRYTQNPAGVGYSDKGWRVGGMALPQIELGPKFISSPTQRVTPAGFGPLAPFWEPRSQTFENLDHEALAWGGCPYPADAPAQMYNAAPLDQRFDQPFQGEETLRLKGLVDGAPRDGLLLNLPRLNPDLKLVRGKRVESLQPLCDTLVIDTDACQLSLVWRVGIPWSLRDQQTNWLVLTDLDLREQLDDMDQKPVA